MNAMNALLSLEANFPSAGRILLPIFSTGELLPAEVEKWKELCITSTGLNAGTNPTSSENLNRNNLVPESLTAHVRALAYL